MGHYSDFYEADAEKERAYNRKAAKTGLAALSEFRRSLQYQLEQDMAFHLDAIHNHLFVKAHEGS